MTSPLRSIAISCVLLGLAAGCASGGKTPEKNPKGTLTSADIDKSNSGEPIEKMLQDKFPGVLVSRTPDGRLVLNIRGMSSANASNEPLYVIDDIPMGSGPGGALVGVNPHDIETIKVLKDPAETARYGMRGANGVILITTKKPGKR